MYNKKLPGKIVGKVLGKSNQKRKRRTTPLDYNKLYTVTEVYLIIENNGQKNIMFRKRKKLEKLPSVEQLTRFPRYKITQESDYIVTNITKTGFLIYSLRHPMRVSISRIAHEITGYRYGQYSIKEVY